MQEPIFLFKVSGNNSFVRFPAASILGSDELDTIGCRMSVWEWLKALKTFSHVFTGDVSFHCNPRSAALDSQGSAFWIPPFVTKIISIREEPKSWKFELNMWQWMNGWLNFILEQTFSQAPSALPPPRQPTNRVQLSGIIGQWGDSSLLLLITQSDEWIIGFPYGAIIYSETFPGKKIYLPAFEVLCTKQTLDYETQSIPLRKHFFNTTKIFTIWWFTKVMISDTDGYKPDSGELFVQMKNVNLLNPIWAATTQFFTTISLNRL